MKNEHRKRTEKLKPKSVKSKNNKIHVFKLLKMKFKSKLSRKYKKMLILYPEHILILHLFSLSNRTFEEKESVKYSLLVLHNLIPDFVKRGSEDDLVQYVSETIIATEMRYGNIAWDDELLVQLKNKFGLREKFRVSDNFIYRETIATEIYFILIIFSIFVGMTILFRDLISSYSFIHF